MVTKEEFTYDSRDNKSKIHAIRWIPQKGEIKGIVQIVHGMVEHIDRYDEFANFLAQQGIVVVGNDHLGHGASVAQDSDRGYFCKKDLFSVFEYDFVVKLSVLADDFTVYLNCRIVNIKVNMLR